MIINPKFARAAAEMREVKLAGRSMGLHIIRFTAFSNGDIYTAFATISQRYVDAVVWWGSNQIPIRCFTGGRASEAVL